MALPTYKGTVLAPGQTPPQLQGQTIKAASGLTEAADKRVMDKRIGNITKVNQENQNLSLWNPWGYVTGVWKAKKARDAMNAPITEQERQLALGDALKPLIEEEMTKKYGPAVEANLRLQKELEARRPQGKIVPTTGPSGPGSLVTQKSAPIDTPQMQQVKQEGKAIAAAKKKEAQDLEDDVVISNLRQVVQKPAEIAGVRPGKLLKTAIRELSLGAVNLDQRDERVKKAEELQFPSSPQQKILEGAVTLGSMLVPYAGLEAGAVKIGNALRNVKAVDSFYKTYPTLARMTVTNLAVNAADAVVREGTGQDYTAKDFLLNIGLQGVFEGAMALNKSRVMSHVENEARALEKSLGREPRPDEILERIGNKYVPGQKFTYGNLFAEQRIAYKSGRNHLNAFPNPEAERRLTYFSGIDPSGQKKAGRPGMDFASVPEDMKPLIEEAKKYGTVDDFIDAQLAKRGEKIPHVPNKKTSTYTGLHEAPTGEFGGPLHDLTDFFPDDLYGPNGAHYYGHFGKGSPEAAMDQATVNIIRQYKNHPDKAITVYRAVPKDVPGEIGIGDWITINKDYARQHGESVLDGKYKIVSKQVQARDIYNNGDSIHEWGYDPQPFTSEKPAKYMKKNEMESFRKRMTEAYNAAKNLDTASTLTPSPMGENRMPGMGGDEGLGGQKMPWDEGYVDPSAEKKPKPPIGEDAFPEMGDDDLLRGITGVQNEIDSLQDSIDILPDMSRYANKRTGELPEVLGTGKSEFGRRGDEIASELGYPDSEALRADHMKRSELTKMLREKKNELRGYMAEFKKRGGKDGDIPYGDIPRDTIAPEEIAGIRTSKMSTEGARRTLRLVTEQNPDLLNARTRGVVTDAAAVEAAADLGITKESLLSMPIGTTLNKEKLTAARMLVAAHGEDVAKLGKTAALEAIAGDSTGVQKEYMRALMEHAQLQGIIKGFAAEAGRGLQALKMKITPLERMQRRFYDILQNADKNQTEALMRQAAGIDINDPDQVLAFIRKNTRHGWLDAVSEFLTAIKLTGPLTHIVNATSNTAYNIAVPLFRIPVAGVDVIRSAVTGTPRERFLREAAADLQGQLGKGAKEAFNLPVSDIKKYLQTKYVPFSGEKTAEAEAYLASIRGSLGETWKALLDEMYVAGGNVEDIIGKVPSIKGNTGHETLDKAIDGFGKVVRTPFRLLNASDTAFRTMAKSGEMHVLATRQAMKEGLRGEAAVKRMYELLENPPMEMLEEAVKKAEYRVFQEPMGQLGQAVNRLRGIPVVGPLIRAFILPFVKTPANLIKRGYQPFNPAAIKRGLAAGGGEASETIARTALGSLTALGLTMLALDGTITGGDPADKKLKDELYDSGWQKYSIRIGNRYYAYDRIEPLQQTIKIAAALADSYKQTGEINTEMLNKAVMDIGTGTLDRSYIRGMNDLLNAAFNPDRYGESWLKQYIVSQPIPALSRTINSLTDTDAQGRPIVREANTLTEYAKSQIPGLAPGLKPRLDSAGRPIVRRRSAVEDAFSPVRSTESALSKAEVEMMRKDFDAMKKISAEDREANAEQKSAALQFIAELKELPMEARVQNLSVLQRKNPDLAKVVSDTLKRRKAGFTFRDETLSSLTVNARAEFMINALREMPAEQRQAQYLDWKRKKIMTEAVEKKLKSLLKTSSKP